MIFPVHVLCGYPSYETAGTKWNDDDYRASKLVKAVKHRPFNGYAKFRTTTIDDTARGRERALRLVAAAAVQKLTQNGLAGTLVALPASNHICFGNEFTGSRITDAIAALDVRFQSRPVLRFEQIMLKAAEGGTRNPAVIAASLDHQGPLDFQSCILVDDVKSTGGHLKGATRYLHAIGVDVVGAFCLAQTVNVRPASIFDIPSETINATPGFLDF